MTLSESVKNKVDKFLEEHPKLTLNAIARRSGIHHSTLTNAIEGLSKPDSFTLLSILKVLYPEKTSMSKILEECCEEELEILKKFTGDKEFSFILKNRSFIPDKKMGLILRDKLNFELFILTHKGITKSEIKENFGHLGVNVILELASNGIVEESEGKYQLKDNIYFDFIAMQEAVSLGVDLLNTGDIGKGVHSLHTNFVRIDEKDVPEFNALVKKHNDEKYNFLEKCNHSRGERNKVVMVASFTKIFLVLLALMPIFFNSISLFASQKIPLKIITIKAEKGNNNSSSGGGSY